jgi:hypothetical protein
MDVLLLLLVRFKKPVRTEFALAFEPRHFGALVNAAPAGSVSMVTREPRVGNGMVEGRNAVTLEIDQAGLLEALSHMPMLRTMAEVMKTLKPE